MRPGNRQPNAELYVKVMLWQLRYPVDAIVPGVGTSS